MGKFPNPEDFDLPKEAEILEIKDGADNVIHRKDKFPSLKGKEWDIIIAEPVSGKYILQKKKGYHIKDVYEGCIDKQELRKMREEILVDNELLSQDSFCFYRIRSIIEKIDKLLKKDEEFERRGL